MADCVSNAAEIVERLRATAKVYFEDISVLYPAADAIEQLLAENAKLKAERDAFVQFFSKTEVWKCQFCAHNRQPHRTAFADCDVAGECKNTDGLPTHFELRGVKEDKNAGKTNSGDPH